MMMILMIIKVLLVGVELIVILRMEESIEKKAFLMMKKANKMYY